MLPVSNYNSCYVNDSLIWTYSHGLGKKIFEEELPSPKSLQELAAIAVNNLPLPECSYWSTEQVAEWIAETLKLPQYKVSKQLSGPYYVS